MMENKEIIIPEEIIQRKIYLLRGSNVMIDSDLAELYDVETRRLNEQVKRNLMRFPEDFMFQLTNEEWDNLMSHFATSSWGGRRKNPYAFTEHGVLMLSSVLNSDRAVAVNIHIMRVYINMRKMAKNHSDLFHLYESLKRQVGENSDNIAVVFNHLKQLEVSRQQESEQKHRRKIGYGNSKTES